MKQVRGLTLLELLITLTVAGILLALAAPNFRMMVQNNRITTQANSFVTAANLARSEALRAGRGVTLCSSTNGEECNGGADWASGWILMASDTEEVLRVWDAPRGNPSLAEQNGRSETEFQHNGSASERLDILHTIPDCTGDQARRIQILRSGRTMVQREDC